MRIEINGNPLEVEVLGRDDAPTMIVHHGAPGLGSRQEPRRSFGPFADRMRVVVFDARGSGESGLQPPFTHEQWVADVEALRAHLGAARVVMAGGSYGGFIALEYALRHADRVAALVLRDTAAHHGFQDAARRNAMSSPRITFDAEMYERMMSGACHDDADLEAGWRAILPLYDHDVDPARLDERLAGTSYHAATHNAAFRDNLPHYDIRDRLGTIRCPTLVTVGRHDWITPPAASEEIAALIPQAELHVFERSGHSPQLEEPEEFQRVVRAFLAGVGLVAATP